MNRHSQPASPPVVTCWGRMGYWRVFKPEQMRGAAAERQRNWRWRRRSRPLGLFPSSTESAVANWRHTNDHAPRTSTPTNSGSFTFMVNGVYDSGTLDKLNWICRDWRLNEPTKMDPHLFDIMWEVYREFRVDAANRRAVRLPVAANERHAAPPLAPGSPSIRSNMQGKAIDAHFPSTSAQDGSAISPCACRRAASASTRLETPPGVHIDSGSVRYWPKNEP